MGKPLEWQCDFCNDYCDPEPYKMYGCSDGFVITPNAPVIYFKGHWLACITCDALIANEDFEALIDRAAQNYINKRLIRMQAVPPSGLQDLSQEIREITKIGHDFFFDHFTGKISDWDEEEYINS